MLKLLYTKEEARDLVGYKRRAFDYAIRDGSLPVIRHGTRVFVTPEALEEFAHKDRPRMTPKMASHASESHSAPVAVQGEDRTTHPTYPDRIEQLRRRRRADGDS